MERHSDLLATLIDKFKAPPSIWGRWELSHVSSHHNCEGTLCALYGLHVLIYSGPNGNWRSDHVVVGDPAREYEYVQTNRSYPSVNQEPEVYSAELDHSNCTVSKGCCFVLQNAVHGNVYAADFDLQNGGPDGKNTVYLPMHKSCLKIALKAPVWDQAASTPLRALFRVLRHRYQVLWEQMRRIYPCSILGPDFERNMHMAINFCGFQNTDGIERGYCSDKCFEPDHLWDVGPGHYLMDDPHNIPRLTQTILENLEPLQQSKPTRQVLRFRKRFTRTPNELRILPKPTKQVLRFHKGFVGLPNEPRVRPKMTKQALSFRKRFGNLPNELKALVLRYVTAGGEWSMTCTRIFDVGFWKAMFNKNLPCMMWLWDLDQKLIRRTDPELNMDWELLFRQLPQRPRLADSHSGKPESDFQCYRGVLDIIPPGLEARRRLWTLLEEMYIGARNTGWEVKTLYSDPRRTNEPQVIPVYWGAHGEPLGDDEYAIALRGRYHSHTQSF
ncbi:hypothetical protein SCUP234_02157 [Seiridium cupressi]